VQTILKELHIYSCSTRARQNTTRRIKHIQQLILPSSRVAVGDWVNIDITDAITRPN